MATDVGVNSFGDYGKRRTGKTPEWKYDCSDLGNNSQFRAEFPVCIDKMKRFNENGKRIGKGNFSDKRATT